MVEKLHILGLSILHSLDNYKLLLYQVGVEDPFIDGVREFTEMFDKYNIDYIYYEMPGGHEGAVWQNGLYNFARRIFR